MRSRIRTTSCPTYESSMAILKVARLGHPVLRQTASEIDPADIRAGKFDDLVEDMLETMDAYEGVGLAGPQVHLPLRIFVFAVEEAVAKRKQTEPLKAGVFFNPTLEYSGEKTTTDWEGCLSVPFLGGEVARFDKVVLRGLDIHADPVEVTMKGYGARIFQHECDHLDGKVYLDRMPDLTTLAYTIVL